jgi:hypothetical protein
MKKASVVGNLALGNVSLTFSAQVVRDIGLAGSTGVVTIQKNPSPVIPAAAIVGRGRRPERAIRDHDAGSARPVPRTLGAYLHDVAAVVNGVAERGGALELHAPPPPRREEGALEGAVGVRAGVRRWPLHGGRARGVRRRRPAAPRAGAGRRPHVVGERREGRPDTAARRRALAGRRVGVGEDDEVLGLPARLLPLHHGVEREKAEGRNEAVGRGEGEGFDLAAGVKEGGDSRGLGLDSAAVDRRFWSRLRSGPEF